MSAVAGPNELRSATLPQVEDIITRLWAAQSLARKTPIYLSGAPGIGKTEFAESLAARLGGDALVFSTSTMDPTDTVGVPFNEGNMTVFAPPKKFLALTTRCAEVGFDPERVLIALFDDLPACHEQVMNALLRFMKDREVCDEKIRDNVLIISTGNRADDRAGAAALTTALANRMAHYEIQVDVDSWLEWAIEKQVDPMIIAFVKTSGIRRLHDFRTDSSEMAFPSPRSVYNASCHIRDLGYDFAHLGLVLQSLCGTAWSTEMMTFMRVREALVPVDQILADPDKAPISAQVDANLVTLTNLLTTVIVSQDVEQCRRAVAYVGRYTNEELQFWFSTSLFRTIGKKNLSLAFKLRSFQEWNRYPTMRSLLA